ncbi:hypothetical protein BD408DRAFT_418964 [Parasitella parasitica]|nr:hypothetical protein BD408DRAFT_418964 [Parasitella parasitica]
MTCSTFKPITTMSSSLNQDAQKDTATQGGDLNQHKKPIIGGCLGGIGGVIVLGIVLG